jgi:large subunit ribosomal protein L2
MILSKYKHRLKYLLNRKQKHAGRNNTGKITVAHQGGGHKQLYRKTITDRDKINFTFLKGIVTNFEYNPNSSSYLAKVCFLQNNIKKYYYIKAPKSLKILDNINHTLNKYPTKMSKGIFIPKQVGNSYYLHEFRVGESLYNIELVPSKGGQLVRSAGVCATVLHKDNNFVLIKLPSGEHRLINKQCKAFFGNLSNENFRKVI